MHRTRWTLGALGVLGLAAAGYVVGCSNEAEDCDRSLTCPKYLTTTTTTDGGGGSIPAGCDPAQNKDAVADTCGAFVSPTGNDESGKGTKASPFKSFKRALEKNDTIYACVGQAAFTEEVVLDKKATLFGGLDCAAWTYDETKRTALTAEPDKIPLELTSAAGGSAIENFAISAKDAVTLGGSSIAVIAEAAEVSFTRTDINAGNGREGEDGTKPTDPVGPASSTDPTIVGNDGQAACTDPSQQFGGSAKENAVCPAASGGPIGGKGGAADTLSGSNGDANPATPKTALGGSGQPSDDMGSWSCVVGAGAIGASGATGDPGDGAKQTEMGTISANGYAGAAGKPGGPGLPGQGGGGGGGAKGKTMCAGASGGGGGAGGCGGGGGTGGKAGGASIGVVSLGATLSFDTVTIHVGIGGKGGDGGGGQAGGTGGKGGTGGNGSANGLSNACDGGNGGQGGFGGKGGGGRGGHAIGIAYTGDAAPVTTGVSFNGKGTAGDGGIGDSANMGDGAKGALADVQKF